LYGTRILVETEATTMKTLAAILLLAACAVGQAAAPAPTPDQTVPTVAGTYYQAASGPSRLELATSSGFKTSGMAKAAFSYGIAKVKGKWLYRNPAAALQLADHRPVFTLVSLIDVSTQAVALIRLDVKKDQREAQYCEAGAWSGVKVEDQNIIPLAVTRIANTNNLTITPQADLPAGEYLLITDQGKGYDGFDFGVK
jgi:hypothetical protein